MINRVRMPLMRCVSLLALALLVAGASYAGPREREVRKQTALDRYVYKPDPNYGFKLVNTTKGEGYTAYVLELTSQQWRTAEEVDRPIWKHWLTIIQPDKVATATGSMKGDVKSKVRPTWLLNHFLAASPVVPGATEAPRICRASRKSLCLFQIRSSKLATA